MKTQIIGFDIGIKNLAFCIVETAVDDDTKIEIKHIEKIDLGCNKNDYKKITERTISSLEEILYEKLDHDGRIIVLIESQMTAVMKCIQTIINVFFKIHAKYMSLDIQTHSVSPKLKLNLISKYDLEYERLQCDQSTQYKQNKIDAIRFGEWLLENKYINESVLKRSQNSKKFDDEMDAFLMCIYFYEDKLLNTNVRKKTQVAK